MEWYHWVIGILSVAFLLACLVGYAIWRAFTKAGAAVARHWLKGNFGRRDGK